MRCLLLTVFTLSIATALHADDKTSQREFTSPVNLLSPEGALDAWGWAKRAQMIYNRDAIPAERRVRIKEWEHYTVMSPKFTVGITIAQLGSVSFGSVEVIDYTAQNQKSAMFFGTPIGKDRSIFPATPYGSTDFRNKDNFISFKFQNGRRQLSFNIPKTALAPAFSGDIELKDDPEGDNIALARPFAGPGEFFYENKIFGMPAKGNLQVDDSSYSLPAETAFAIFDWGRGIWPRNSQWFWGQAAGNIDGRIVAINLGHGYGDDSRGTANAILAAGKLHKLGDVKCAFDPQDRMRPWNFASDDGRLALTFQPTYHQHAKQEVLIAATELHKIHGTYSGKLIVDGMTIEVADLLGFAEHMSQRW